MPRLEGQGCTVGYCRANREGDNDLKKTTALVDCRKQMEQEAVDRETNTKLKARLPIPS